MKVIFDPEEPIDDHTSATIGNFDGVHVGHKAIIKSIKNIAGKKGLSTCVITFHPHPQKVLQNIDVPLLVPIRERLRLLEKEGVDYTACYTFTKDISRISAKDFITDILVGKLNVKHLIVGPDFSFGKKREGNAELLRKLGKEHGFETEVIGPVLIDNEIVSSTAIRDLLLSGDARKAAKFLGYNFYLEGQVKQGEKRGRKIGFPTTNLETDWDILPKTGVYATHAFIDNKKFDSITNVGFRPTFGNNKLLIETHVFGFNSDIYGKRIKVEFVERIRDEERFESVDALVAQIKKDVARVKNILAGSD